MSNNSERTYTAAEVAELLKSDNGWHGPAFCVPIAEVSALKAQCAAILEKVANRVESIGTDASEGYKLACEDAAMIVRALVPTDYAAALAERERLARLDEFMDTVVMCTQFPKDEVIQLIKQRTAALRAEGAKQP